MLVQITPDCKKRIDDLLKQVKHGYGGCYKSLKEYFSTISEAEAKQNPRNLLTKIDRIEIYKLRIPCPDHNEGKSYGYRAIILFDLALNTATLVTFYPKFGKKSAVDLAPNGCKILLSEYDKALRANSIMADYFL
jgi:hypothetical protein